MCAELLLSVPAKYIWSVHRKELYVTKSGRGTRSDNYCAPHREKFYFFLQKKKIRVIGYYKIVTPIIFIDNINSEFFPLWRCGPTRAMASSFLRFLDHTQRRITIGRTSLDELSARRRDLYLTTHNTQHRHPCPRRVSNLQPEQESGRRPTP